MNIKVLASFAAFIAMVVGFVGYTASLGIRIKPPENRMNLSMDVSDVNNIVANSNVLLHGVPVGKVSRVDTSPAIATIHFYVEDKYQIPVDSDVRLENLSALGESYIELEPRTAGGPALQDGQRIATEAVKRPASISELGVTVVDVLNQLDPGQLSRVIGEVDTGLPDPNRVLPNLGRASLLLLNTTRDLNGRGSQALANLQVLLQNAGWVGPALADSAPYIRALGPPLQATWNLGADTVLRVPAPGSVYILGAFVQRIQDFLDDRAADIRILTEPLLANVKAIAAAASTIDTGRMFTNLLAAVPEDGAINLHVTIPESEAGN